MKSKAIRIHETGGPDCLSFDEVDLSSPGANEALVRHTAIGVNFIDTYHRTGLYPVSSLPHGIGMEAAGVVEAIGDAVTEVKVGDRVAYAAGPPGSYAEHRLIAADRLVNLPDGLDDAHAAGAMLKGMTVEYLVRRTFKVERGQTVLLHAAAGGVGLIACQWLKHLGATIIGTVGSSAKAELASAFGCDHTILYKTEDFTARVQELTDGKGVPVVYDSVGKATFMGSLDCLAPRGMMVSFGNASGAVEAFDLGLLAQKGSLFVTRPTLMAYTASRADLQQSANALFAVLKSGTVRIEVNQRWSLASARTAHRALEARETTGSSLLIP